MVISQNLVGQTIVKRYHLKEQVGQGATGTVYRALDRKWKRPVAIKLLEGGAQNGAWLGRFFHGARLAQMLQHPSIASTYEYGRWGAERAGAFLTMEFVSGLPLGALANALPPEQLVGLTQQILEGLGHVHARGVLHRDIKPDNILVVRRRDGRLLAKLTDFGIAVAFGGEGSQRTTVMESRVVGTPQYMAPEQMTEIWRVGPAADLYATGVVLYELLSGHAPFVDAQSSALGRKAREEAPVLKPKQGMVVPEGLSTTLARLIARDPDARFQRAGEAIRALEPYASRPILPELEWALLLRESLPILPTDSSPGGLVLADAPTMGPEGGVWGRGNLLDQVRDLAHQALEGGGGVVILHGQPGVGKSVLLEELTVRLVEDGEFIALKGAFDEGAAERGGLRQALEGYLRTAGLPADAARQAVTYQLSRLDVTDPAEIDDVVRLIRPENASNAQHTWAKEDVFAVFVRLMRRIAAQRPVALALDDLDTRGRWVGDFLDYLRFELSLEPFPLVFLGCCDELHKRTPLGASLLSLEGEADTLQQLITVPPLDPQMLAEMLAGEFGIGFDSATQAAHLAGGNPLIARQLAMIPDLTKTMDGTGDGLDLVAMVGGDLSPALSRLLERLIDGHLQGIQDEDNLRTVMTHVAVLGDATPVELLAEDLADVMTRSELEEALDGLIAMHLMVERAVGPERRLTLTPRVLESLLLSQVPAEALKALHRRAITSRTTWAGRHGWVDAQAGAIGSHHEALGETDQAVTWWLRAQFYESSLGDSGEGLKWGFKALDYLEPNSAEAAHCALTLGRVLLDGGELQRAEQVLRHTLGGPDADLAMMAGEVLTDVYENKGAVVEWGKLMTVLTARLDAASPAGHRAFLRSRALWRIAQGEPDRAAQDAEAALVDAEAGEEAQRAAQRLVYANLARRRLDEAEQAAHRALREAGTLAPLRVRSLRALGNVYFWTGRPQQAVKAHDEVREICRSRGLFARIPIALHDLGDALRVGKEIARAKLAYNRALLAAQKLNLRHIAELVKVKQLMCELSESNTDDVIHRLDRAIPRCLAVGLGLARPFCTLLKAWAYTMDGAFDEAVVMLQEIDNYAHMAVDPQIPEIMEAMADRFSAATVHQTHATALYQAAASLWDSQGASVAAKQARDKMDA